MVTAVSYDHNLWLNNRVNTDIHDVTNKHYHILPADNNYDRNTNAGDLFPYMNVDSISINGSPKLSAAKTPAEYSVYNIKAGDVLSFYAGPDRASTTDRIKSADIDISISDGNLSVKAPVGSRLSVYDISGKTVLETVTSEPDQLFSLPGSGIWIIRCNNTVRKVQK